MSKFLSQKEVMDTYGLSRMTLLNYEEQGLLHPARTGGGHRRYDQEEIERLFTPSGYSFDLPQHQLRFLEWYGNQLKLSPRDALCAIVEEAMLTRIAAYQEIPMPNDVNVEIWTEDQTGNLIPARIYNHNDTLYTEGINGKRYAVKVQNNTPGRILAVVSVDGLDIHDGKDAAFNKDGLVIPAFGQYLFEGFRLSNEEIAAFRFGTQEKSYASKIGKPRNIGVIGVALYQEQITRMDIFHHYPSPYRRSCPIGASPFWSTAPLYRGTADESPYAPHVVYSSGEIKHCNSLETTANVNVTSVTSESTSPIQETRSLGTVFGEARKSEVTTTEFQRKTETPWLIFTIRYDSRENLKALGIPVIDQELSQRESANPFPASPRHVGHCQPPTGWTGKLDTF